MSVWQGEQRCNEWSRRPRRMPPARASRSVLARQVDHVVREVERDFIEREVGERDFLRENDVVIAVVAGECCGIVGTDDELPDLKPLGRDTLQVEGGCESSGDITAWDRASIGRATPPLEASRTPFSRNRSALLWR